MTVSGIPKAERFCVTLRSVSHCKLRIRFILILHIEKKADKRSNGLVTMKDDLFPLIFLTNWLRVCGQGFRLQ